MGFILSKTTFWLYVQNNFLALCLELLTTSENRLLSSMLSIIFYLYGIVLHCSFFYLKQGLSLFVFKSVKMPENSLLGSQKFVKHVHVLQERHDRYIYDRFCYVSDIYTQKRLPIAVRLTKSRLKKFFILLNTPSVSSTL